MEGRRPTRVAASVEVRKPAGPVFQACLDLIGDWWPPEGLDGDEYLVFEGRIRCELWAGGEVVLVKDTERHLVGEVVLCDAPYRLVVSVRQPRWAAASRLEITVVERPSGVTQLTVDHRGFGATGLPAELDWYSDFLPDSLEGITERLGS